mgnify:CR=1 FL=1
MVSQPPSPDPVPQIQQDLQGDRNQVIGQVLGGIVVYVGGGQAIINPTAAEHLTSTASPAATIGPNPYKGLLAFQEADSANFFGRSHDIQHLWEQFRDLQNADVRLLPVYGPSGSGKSSLVRAGLIPELGKRHLPGRNRARAAVLVPSEHPLEALATILARVATNDPLPAEKAEEFERVLKKVSEGGAYEGLRRIASMLPEIATFPLIVMVDQFEEVYSLCKDTQGRDAFIANLLHAASASSRYVSVILTLRSDFLGETQQHPVLNRLFSSHGFLVPTMGEDNLREVIAQPAEQSGHALDLATVNLLIEQTEGREGALPLLQFALTRIWEGLKQGTLPAVTLEQIDGVGGALAGEAQRIYESLSPADQPIARRVFLGLVQLGEGAKDTRRRVEIGDFVSQQSSLDQVKQVIARFADPGARLITLAANRDAETAEVTHEALFDQWQDLGAWLKESRLFLTWKNRLRTTMHQWEISDREPEVLLRGTPLAEAEDWLQRQEADLSQSEQDYIQAGLVERDRLQKTEQERQQREYDLLKKFVSTAQTRTKLAISAAGLAIVALLAGGFAWYQQQQAQQAQQAFLLGIEPAKPELLKKLPDFLKEAGRLSSTRKEENVQLALAYYRKILTDTNALLEAMQSTPTLFQKQDNQSIEAIAKNAENGLVETIRIYRIPQLEAELKRKQWGNTNDQRPSTDIKNRFTGALRTTTEILMSNFGANADLSGNGQIDNPEEAERLPCDTLKDLEELWRRFANQQCGWYGPTNEYEAPACGQLDGKTLMTSVFVPPFSEITKHLESCSGISKPVKVNSQN